MIRDIANWFNVRRRIVALLLVGWVGLVVVSAGKQADFDDGVVLPNLGDAAAALISLLVLVGLVLLMFLRLTPRSRFRPRRKQSILTLLLIGFAIVAAVVLFGPEQTAVDEAPAEADAPSTAQFGEVGVVEDSFDGPRDGDIVLLVVIGLLGGAVLWWTRWSARMPAAVPDEEPDPTFPENLGPAIEEAARHLRVGNDSRLAVLASYASLEGALAAQGQHRDPSETPTEHMARVLASLHALAAPAAQLGHLYSLARFSDQPIRLADRQRAAGELERALSTLGLLAGRGS